MTTIASEQQRSAAERLLASLTNFADHLWHGRIGMVGPNGKWTPRGRNKTARPIPPGLYEPAAVALYQQVLDLYQMDPIYVGQFASFAMRELDWADLKVVLCAFLLVQPQDILRDVGEAMILLHADKTVPVTRRLRPKDVLRVAKLLHAPGIVAINRQAGFGSPGAKNPPLGRFRQVATRWLLVRERNAPLLKGLAASGYASTVRSIARYARYKPEQGDFFSTVRYGQKQAEGGHREIAVGVKLAPASVWTGKTEKQIVALIQQGDLSYQAAVGRIPPSVGLTRNILRALAGKMSDQDLVIAAPALEESGLLDSDAEIQKRFIEATNKARSHRALTVAKNVRSEKVKDQLEAAVASANAKAVAEAVPDRPLRVMLLVDISGSQQGAVDRTKTLLPTLIAGLSADRVHVAAFNTAGRIIHAGVGASAGDLGLKQAKVLLASLKADGGTSQWTAVDVLSAVGVRKQPDEILILLVIGDEADSDMDGSRTAQSLRNAKLLPDAVGLILNMGSYPRGAAVRGVARQLKVPFNEVDVAALSDTYQIPRVLRGLLDAPVSASESAPARFGLLERISAVTLLVPPVVPRRRAHLATT